ncbi:restriction endonuclease subunit S [Xanthomonas oryzae pv. oryzae]|uniref:restriction endonuclease subunit S n=2 Tax=Xanthomonas oryzae TaxID=347 RepID=UPI000DDE69C5|nr:restriction endonuclease subunit S [Xanthomonas oryzae]AXX68286.1 restriction endonuclease [Xanthomonas oryzae pv. oryzae]RBG64386.1 restriction endonuclease subunit S [Xanthomonas oryzae pv. oryzae]UAD92115.1 restriction endonuclease subunit S [Xanthomonas oryzae pv. oryzae]UHC70956.1 restriction endonuclease subunit S [Xanthomonas oryzae pv. oryzae]URJ81359.1 restriction endonuclease subunit S [Xanthomonas oryzae pv. oryzae]
MSDTPNIDIRPDHWQIVRDILRKHVPQYAVWAFGSRAKWLAKQYSDLDLAIITDQPLSLSISAALADDFSESDLPWKVDVVDWAATGKSFQQIIERDRVVVQKSIPGPSSGMVSEWRDTNWGEEISLEYGKAIRGYDEVHGKYRVFGSNGAIGWTGEALTEGPGVILGRKGAYRGVRFWRDPFWVIDTAYYVVPKEKLDMRWIYYAIKHHRLGEIDDGSPIPSTTRAAVYVRELMVPSLKEQRAIACILGALDDKIELNRRMNQTLEAMARALFKSWFVDFDGVPPDDMQESELGLIPKGWKLSRLGVECSYLSRGISPEYIEDGGVLVINQKCIRDFSIDTSKARRHDPTQRSVEERKIQFGDVLVNSTGVGTLGRVAQVLSLDEPTVVDSHVTVVRAGQRLRHTYLGQWFSDKQSEIQTMGEGSTGQTELSRLKLAHMPILIPSQKLLADFDAIVSPLNSKIALADSSSRSLATLRDALLPKLITGELRVQDVERLVESVA